MDRRDHHRRPSALVPARRDAIGRGRPPNGRRIHGAGELDREAHLCTTRPRLTGAAGSASPDSRRRRRAGVAGEDIEASCCVSPVIRADLVAMSEIVRKNVRRDLRADTERALVATGPTSEGRVLDGLASRG